MTIAFCIICNDCGKTEVFEATQTIDDLRRLAVNDGWGVFYGGAAKREFNACPSCTAKINERRDKFYGGITLNAQSEE